MMRKRLFYRPLQARTPESAKKHFQGFFTDQRYFFRLLVLKQIGYSTILPSYVYSVQFSSPYSQHRISLCLRCSEQAGQEKKGSKGLIFSYQILGQLSDDSFIDRPNTILSSI